MNKPGAVYASTSEALQQLDQLMRYAEDLQDTIERRRALEAIRESVYYSLVVVTGTIIVTGTAYAISRGLPLGSALLIPLGLLLALLATAAGLLRYGRLKSEAAVERRILSEMVEMSSALFRHLEPEKIGPIDHQLFALRLRRLSLSGN